MLRRYYTTIKAIFLTNRQVKKHDIGFWIKHVYNSRAMSKFAQLSRYLTKVYPSQETLEKRLEKSGFLKIYLGIDPTSPNIHLGNAISLFILRQFQDWGHQIVLVFGDFTGSIGDPSGHDRHRKPLDSEQLLNNTSSYKNQVRKILDFEKNPPQIVFNSQWWLNLNLKDFFGILNTFTLSQLIERDLFQERIKNNQPIAVSEFLYPILQGYDSVELDTDIEIGGNDQTFNMLIGREMLKSYKSKEKFVLTTPILEGTDGKKMSKSYGNTIDLSTDPNDMFGKIMSIKDSLIVKYMLLTTTMETKEIEKIESELKSSKINPMEAKKKLAFSVVSLYNGVEKAKKSQLEFERVFQKGERTSAITKVSKSKTILPKSFASLATDAGATPSVSAAIRLAENKGLKFDGKLVTDPRQPFNSPSNRETVIDVGKRKSIKITWKD